MSADNQKRIKVLENGPYEVSGNVPINQLTFIPNQKGFSVEYKKTDDYEMVEPYHLCRCGQSKNKPCCDGSHLNGFNGTETAHHKSYEEMAKSIKGIQMDLLDAEELCAAARFCDTKSGTWNLVENAENPEAKEIIEHQCTRCPSGRLTAVSKDGTVIEPVLPKEISVLEDTAANVHGPLWIKGGIEIEDSKGQTYPVRNRVTLCRCGKSKNKPFCDGHHMQDAKR
ncbi:CDGSH iron-sulfur domain-containing protein [Bacteroidales bacterium OttesenSCG-928-C19]|nr:CDGSH iron-sulfur domain-containing protein [Bacteroidales bacterium OttesenSCG-928-C19]